MPSHRITRRTTRGGTKRAVSQTARVADEADLIVIGSGQGGVPLAATMAARGEGVVLFERGPFGGTCINVGCTPSKTFLAAAHNAGRARAAATLGIHADVRVDQHAVFQRVNRIRDAWSDQTGRRLLDAGVDVVRADASFVGEREVAGGGRTVRARRVVIDTGTAPFVPTIEGIEATAVLTNDNFFDQRELPGRLLVLGAGYIGLELGQGAQRLGSAVTILHPHDRVLEKEEPDASALLADALTADGVRLELRARVVAVLSQDGAVRLRLADGREIEGDALLVATGRTPRTATLNLAASGIDTTQRGFVRVDDQLQSTCPGVYALGDVAGQPAFTHVSWEDHRRLLSTFGGTPRRRDDRVLSYSTFTEPQIGRTGCTEEQARATGVTARSVTLPLSAIARATEWGLGPGFFRMVIDDATDRIIGATFAGYEAGELIHVIAALIEAGATWQVLARSMFVHPTLAEGLPTLAERFAANTTPK